MGQMEQLDIMGNWVKVEEEPKKLERLTIKEKFRAINGYIESDKTCKDCDNFRTYNYRGKRYFKCVEMGLSHSKATDIRKSDKPCRLFKDESRG